MEKPLDKVIRISNALIPKNLATRGLVHIMFSLVTVYMSFFVYTALAIFLVLIAIMHSAYGWALIFHADNKQSE